MNTETNIRRISIALKRCQRQVNALTEVVIPELSQERIRVEQRLEEKEREAIFQVKLLKARQR
jgi:vacuolar-type H+-ATPase subunit D/Vma8